MPSTKGRVFDLYRNLHFILKSYPVEEGTSPTLSELNSKLNAAFRKQAELKDPAAIEKQIEFGWYIYREIEALIKLSRYRTLKRKYSWQAPSVDDLLGDARKQF